MKKFAFKLTATFALLAGLAGAGWIYAAMNLETHQHLSNSNCASCHLAGDGVKPENAAVLISSQELLCKKCHPTAVQASHPSGFTPKNKPSSTYPLDWKGDLTCSTCHDIHGSELRLLRGAQRGKAFCLSCHNANFFEEMRDKGISMLAGHLGIETLDVSLLDTYSAECMGCHENNVNVRIATSVDRNGIVRHAGGSSSHPIGSIYNNSVTAGGYRSRHMVSNKILFPDGKLSCVSCHQGYAKEHGKLVISNGGSALCLECHDK